MGRKEMNSKSKECVVNEVDEADREFMNYEFIFLFQPLSLPRLTFALV